MGVWHEWADDSKLILNVYVEHPWTIKEYVELIEEVTPMLHDLNRPVATVVDVSHMGHIARDGSIIQLLLNVERLLPKNVFASAVVGTPNSLMVFMNVLFKLRPGVQRIAFFTATIEEAHEQIHARYHARYLDMGGKSPGSK